jgi:peroxiredoxin
MGDLFLFSRVILAGPLQDHAPIPHIADHGCTTVPPAARGVSWTLRSSYASIRITQRKHRVARMKFLFPLLLLAIAAPAHAALDEQQPPAETQPLELADREGRVHAIGDYRGQVLVVNFWGSWCPPCVRELPGLNRLRQAFAGRPFEILGVNVAEHPNRLKRFLKQHPIEFPVLYDRESEAYYAWKVKALPTSFVIDRSGRVRYRAAGALEWDSMEIIGIIDGLLAEEEPPAAATTP